MEFRHGSEICKVEVVFVCQHYQYAQCITRCTIRKYMHTYNSYKNREKINHPCGQYSLRTSCSLRFCCSPRFASMVSTNVVVIDSVKANLMNGFRCSQFDPLKKYGRVVLVRRWKELGMKTRFSQENKWLQKQLICFFSLDRLRHHQFHISHKKF